MHPFQEPGITYGAKADDVMMRGCIDICITVGIEISKRIAKFEQGKLNQEASQRYEQVSFIAGIFKKKMGKGFGIYWFTGLYMIRKPVKQG
jgi:hypothetical protein